MNKLNQLEQLFRPNFIWDREGLKPLQVSEEYEGAKDLARTIFVGVAQMIGFDSASVQEYLDMPYDSYRNKVQHFRSNYNEALRRKYDGTFDRYEDPVRKFWNKLMLVQNAIYWSQNRRLVATEEWLKSID